MCKKIVTKKVYYFIFLVLSYVGTVYVYNIHIVVNHLQKPTIITYSIAFFNTCINYKFKCTMRVNVNKRIRFFV